ncbi:TIGR02594, TIGR02594 family protein [uncultured Caudovirales phage]|uniref:TIGR02594, TIGR02594 family protein n=1 Tax=uncultured Caudovirales phage TaxID=2100421 RepID=A0A6J5SBA0_9CAUD|nr:TIGR02594, TIGR02594 family protein [uncultured Caudovirales phage]CAB4197238.1 TIGR02594, TIGR02594 family protein [uncultured Caudovirales phage]CAB4210732.1 TIGR02594, TIGR02594 family protein [uncultured Caudovirales phage]
MNTPAWLKIALGEAGVKEVAGDKANPRILLYHSITTLRATSDEVAWCSAFVCWCLERGGVRSSRSSAARSFLNWGQALLEPVPGCIVVISRGPDQTKGHVGFWLAETEDHVLIYGGNQGNGVNVSLFEKFRVLGYRMPVEMKGTPNGSH